jgi:hypothetical protein
MVRNLFFRLGIGAALCACLSASALAQYGGGGGTTGTGTTATYPTKSYGSGAAIGAGVGGAAAAGLVAYMVLHKPHLVGCVEPSSDGLKLMNEKDKNTYAIDTNGEDLKPGERVQLIGKKIKDGSGKLSFQVQKPPKDLGPCKQ